MTKSCIIKLLPVFLMLHWNCYPLKHKTNENPAATTAKIEFYLERSHTFLYKPESYKIDMDSARSNVDKAYALSTKIRNQDFTHLCLLYYGEILFEENNYPKAIDVFHEVLAYYQKTKQLKKEAKVWEKLGARLFWQTPRNFQTLEESVPAFDKAAALYKILGLQEDRAYMLKSKADAHLNQGRVDLAEKELLDILALYKKMGYKKLHFTYDLLADSQRLKGDLGKSLYYSLLCVKSMENTGDFGYAPIFYEQLGVAYRDLGQHELSIDFIKKAISYLKSKKEIDYSNLYEFIDVLCKELIQIKRPKEALNQVQNIIKEYPPHKDTDQATIFGTLAYCYNKNNQIKLAESNYIKMISLYEKSVSKMYIINLSEAYFQLGKFYAEHKIYDKAKINFNKSLNFSAGIVELSQIKEANLYLFKIDSAKGNYFGAIKHFQKYKNLNDSIFNEKKTKQIEELQILYGLEKKEKELSNLKMAMDGEKEKTNHAQNTIKLGVGVVALLLLSTVLFWRSYKSKQKKNILLKQQKEEIDHKNNTLQKLVNEKESLMQEIHHRVKNNLQIVMSLLNSQSSTLKNPEAFDAIQKSQHRLFAISLLHQKLYRTDIVRAIEMKSYMDDLICNLADTFGNDRINFEVAIDAISLNEAQAVAVGLILNETVTNAIKYGFPDNKKGTIFITMQSEENHQVILKIKDNGIGFPQDFVHNELATLGINLITGLAQQLDGKVTFANNNGAMVTVVFTSTTISSDHP